jgi:hypothetical protein
MHQRIRRRRRQPAARRTPRLHETGGHGWSTTLVALIKQSGRARALTLAQVRTG